MMTNTSDAFAVQLKRLRCRAGLTVRELSRRAGLAMTYCYQIEKGDRVNPSVDVLRRLAGVIGCNVADFFREARNG